MTFLGWLINQCDLVAINYRNNLVLFTINLVDYIVSIDCKWAFDCHIVCRHGCWCFAPSTEGVTLLGWLVNQCNFAAIGNCFGCVYLTVYKIGHGVEVDSKWALDCNILGRHCRRCLAPSTEGVTLLGWHNAQNYFTSICNTIGCKDNAIDQIIKFILVYLILAGVNNIFSRRQFRNAFPTGKSISGSFGYLRLYNSRTGALETLAYNLAITNESYIIVGILCLCIQGQLRCIVICFTTTQHNIIYNYGSVLVLHTTVWYECQIKQFTLVTGYTVIIKWESYESVSILINLCNRARMPGQALGNFQIIVGGCHSRHEMYIHLYGNYAGIIIKPNAHYIITVP